MFKGGQTQPPQPPEVLVHIMAIQERQDAFEIKFPNIIEYRIDNQNNKIIYDFNAIGNYEIEGIRFPIVSTTASPISPDEQTLEVKCVLEIPNSELFYLLTKELIKYHFSEEDKMPNFQLFSKLKKIVAEW